MAKGKASRLSISTRHLIIEYSKKGFSDSFVRFVYRSYFISCVRLIKLTNETNDSRHERTNYTNEMQTNGKRTNDTSKRNKRKTRTIRIKPSHFVACETADNMLVAHSGAQHVILRCVFALFFFVLCTLYCHFSASGEASVRFVYRVSFVRSLRVSFVRISFRAFV
jgi:hypothetical protein